MSKIKELKNWLKTEAITLRELKRSIAEIQRAKGSGAAAREQGSLISKKQNYRHHHIAYCELRGKTREQIERPRQDNQPSEYMIQEIKKEYAWSPEEIEAYKERQERRKSYEAA